MKYIPLSNGQKTKVDDRDYDFLTQWKWRVYGSGYVGRNSRQGVIYMHRVLAGGISGKDVDHKNGDKLDNQKWNLRLVTKSENQRGFRLRNKETVSGVRGVHWFPRTKKWTARIKAGDKHYNLGYFTELDDAIKARQEAEKKYWG